MGLFLPRCFGAWYCSCGSSLLFSSSNISIIMPPISTEIPEKVKAEIEDTISKLDTIFNFDSDHRELMQLAFEKVCMISMIGATERIQDYVRTHFIGSKSK